MKKLLCLIVLSVLLSGSLLANMQKEVVIFSQPCHFCDALKQDLKDSLINDYPDIKFTVLDIRKSDNRRLLDQYARQHDLRGDIGLPLLFIGKNYLMGWSEENKTKLKEYIAAYEQEELSRLPASLRQSIFLTLEF